MQKLSDTFNSISVKKGEEFTIELMENGGAGFLWDFNVVSGKALNLGRVAETPIPFTNDTPIGGAHLSKTRFQAIEAGLVTIEAVEQQPWNNNVLNRRTFTIQVD